jgi:uncharacterized membrane protein
MKTIKDTQYLISETAREVEALRKSMTEQNKKAVKKDIKKKLDRVNFLRDIILYLESEPREMYLKEQVEKLTYRIGQVDEKIAYLESISKAAQALANQKKSLKAEFNYDKHKRQLEVILFILN